MNLPERLVSILLSRRTHVYIALFLLLVLVIPFVWTLRGIPTFMWSWVYNQETLEGIHSFEDLCVFFRDLRVSIPPVLVLFEILTLKLTGGLYLITDLFYRFLFVLSFFMSIAVFKRTIGNVWLSLAQALVFAWGASWIHPLNPQIYDFWFPCCLLLYLYFLRKSADEENTPYGIGFFCFLSGLFLTFTELSRPFVFFMMPVILLFSLLRIREYKWRHIAYFILPIIFFSGGWHLKLYSCNDRQILITNHSGYNLERAWRHVPLPDIEKLHAEGYNHPEHSRINNQLRNAIVRYILTHPISSVNHSIRRLCALLEPQVHAEQVQQLKEPVRLVPPTHPLLNVYILLVRLSALYLLFCLIQLTINCVTHFDIDEIVREENIHIICTAAALFFLAVGESGEEYRFLISALPLLAATQWAPGEVKDRYESYKSLILPVMVFGLICANLISTAVFYLNDGQAMSAKNVAPIARVEVSSNHPYSWPGGAIDGIVSGHPFNSRFEWIADQENEGAWIRLRWDTPQWVDRVWLYDRPNYEDQILEGELVLNSNPPIPFGALDDDAVTKTEIKFSPEWVSTLTVRVKKVKPKGPNTGLAEIIVFRSNEKEGSQ